MTPPTYTITGYPNYRLMLDPFRVINIKTRRPLKPSQKRGALVYYTFTHNNQSHTMSIYSVAARAFIGEPPGPGYTGELIQPQRGIQPGNLRWITTREYRSRHSPQRRMTPALILQARELRSRGMSGPQIAQKLNVGQATIWRYVRNIETPLQRAQRMQCCIDCGKPELYRTEHYTYIRCKRCQRRYWRNHGKAPRTTPHILDRVLREDLRLQCAICGSEFAPGLRGGLSKYCSDECRSVANNRNTKAYRFRHILRKHGA